MPVGGAIALAGVAGAGAQIYGAQQAASAQRDAASQGIDFQKNMLDDIKSNYAPWQQAGLHALPGLQALTDPGQSADYLSQMPGYQFQLKQGLQAAQNGFAAQGLGSSGAAMKGGINYAEGLAGTSLQQQFDMLFKQAGLGASAAGQQGNAMLATASGVNQNLLGAGNATAGADVASGNAVANGLNNSANSYLQYNLLQKLGQKPSTDQTAAAVANPNAFTSGTTPYQPSPWG